MVVSILMLAINKIPYQIYLLFGSLRVNICANQQSIEDHAANCEIVRRLMLMKSLRPPYAAI